MSKKKKEKDKYPGHTNELTYFLDHKDIKREECVGNGSTAGASPSSAPTSGKPFANVGAAVTRGNDSSAQMKQGQQKHASSRGFSKMVGNLFGKKP